MTTKPNTPIDPSTVCAGWSAKRIMIGRILLEDVMVSTHEGSTFLTTALTTLMERTRRPRSGSQSRFAEPLPLSTPSRLLSVEAADFIKDMARRGISQNSFTAPRHVFRLWKLAAGDIPVSEISPDHIRKLWDVVRWFPERAGSQKRFEAMSDEQILEIGKASNRPPPARATTNAVRRYLATFFNRMLRLRVIAFSPLEAFGDMRDDLVDAGRRRPYSQQELSDIFDHEWFVPWARQFPHRWWGPMLALYTGARSSEIGQLKIADIVCQEGTWCICFRKTLDEDLVGEEVRTRQRLKGRSSIRTVPIAQPILDAGFLEFVEDAKCIKHARLFPHLPSGVNRKSGKPNGSGYGLAMSNQFSKFLKQRQDIEKGVVFHSFRHLFVTLLEEAGTPRELIASMTGHTVKQNVPVLESHYIHLRPSMLRQRQVDALAKFNPGVQLPRYQPGQFAAAYRADARIYP